MKKLSTLCLGVAVVAVTLVPFGVSAQTNLKLLSSWSSSNKPIYAMAETFVENVNQIGHGKVKISISGPEVVPAFEQLQPVSSGVFDMLFTHGVYHAGSKGLALVIDAIDLNPVMRRKVGITDLIDKYYQKQHNLKMVSMPSMSFFGYHLYTKKPLTAAGDIKGQRIRGTQSYQRVIESLGGSLVVLPFGETYSALQKGVVDGVAFPAAGVLSTKHYEVTQYRLRPTFGTSNEPIFINLDKWNRLSSSEQAILLEAGKKTELEMPWIGNGIQAQEDAKLDALGMKYSQLSAQKAAMVKKAWNDSLWVLAEKCCGDAAKELRALALKNGMTQ